MRTVIAILAAKAALKLNRLSGSGGTALPGLVAQKLDADILAKLTLRNFPRGIIVVTGTNGKTTTTRLIANVLDEAGISYVHNRTGSNLERGLVASVVGSASLRGRVDADVGLFEVDEAYIPRVCRAVKPKMVVVTNLFRDQLDRYGELDKIARSFRDVFDDLAQTQLVLNADDPLVASLGFNLENERKITYFGVGDFVGNKLNNDRTADSVFDPFTQEKLYYTQQYFGHIGKYRSKNSDFTRPKVDFEAHYLKQKGIEGISFVVNKTTKPIKLGLPGIFNVYNSIAAYAVSKSFFDLDEQQIVAGITSSTAAFGRSEKLYYQDREILMLLVKNPTGLNQMIQTYLLNEPDRLLVFVINDNFADGRDVSWLWDAALEDLKSYKGKIIASGSRAYDMALRLKYAGITDVLVVPNSKELLGVISQQSTRHSKVFVLPTYTAMLGLRSSLVAEDDKLQEYWQ